MVEQSRQITGPEIVVLQCVNGRGLFGGQIA